MYRCYNGCVGDLAEAAFVAVGEEASVGDYDVVEHVEVHRARRLGELTGDLVVLRRGLQIA